MKLRPLYFFLTCFYLILFAGFFILKVKNSPRLPKDNSQAISSKEDIILEIPKKEDKIKNPQKVKGLARSDWFFEGQFNLELYDANKNILGRTILVAKEDWMKEGFIPFEGEITFSQPTTSFGFLRFLSANPSGIPENQKIFETGIFFETPQFRKIFLHYYNPLKDKDELGNIKCSKEGLVPIEREIPLTQTPIQDTINLLLKGRENLTEEEKKQGITTEFPLEGFKLKLTNLKKDGTLILEFDDPLKKSVGGSCRINILRFQIEETAKQFPEVKRVEFFPEDIFQP